MLKIFHLFLMLSLLILIPNAYAQTNKQPANTNSSSNTISLYQQPDSKSPVVASIQANQPIMPIFTQGDWTKIADPSNGNVGWVSNQTLKQQGIPYTKIITQSFKSPNQMGSSQTIEYVESVRTGQ